MWKVRELVDKATNVVMNYTDIEAKVREATNDDAWGPTGALMQEVAQGTFTYEQFPEVMSMLWKRMLQDNKKNWRRTYKSLLLLNYLVRNGSERVVTSAREHIYDLRSLENYTYIDEYGKDQGINVRHKVRELIDFIQDDDKLREERKKAKKNKDKYVGMSSDAMGMRFGSSGWDDTPRWKKEDLDWDSGGNARSRHRSFEDSNNSDDGEREDSDGEGRRTGREYRDKDSDSLDSGDRRSNRPASSPTAGTPVRSSKPIKRIDLGAAAHYGKDSNSGTASPMKNNSTVSHQNNNNINKNSGELLTDILGGTVISNNGSLITGDDDFNPRSGEELSTNNTEFGDFSKAFGTPAPTNNPRDNQDDFADFASAFTGTPSSQPQTVLQQSAQIQLSLSNKSAVSPITNNAAVITGAQQSNTDLLTDLGGFSSPAFGSNLGASTVNSVPSVNPLDTGLTVSAMPACVEHQVSAEQEVEQIDYVKNQAVASMKQRHRTGTLSFMEVVERVLLGLNSLPIRNEKESMTLKNNLEELLKHFPGQYTPQKFCDIDTETQSFYIFRNVWYKSLLQKLLDLVLSDCCAAKNISDTCSKIFCIDGAPLSMFHSALSVLVSKLQDVKGPSRKCEYIVFLLEKLLKCTSLRSAILDYCKVDTTSVGIRNGRDPLLDKEDIFMWDETLQLLVSLTSRVANKLQDNTLECFYPDNYCMILVVHVAHTLHFLVDAVANRCLSFRIEGLSDLLSKIFLHFNNQRKSPALLSLLTILESWCEDTTFSLVSGQLMSHLSRQACELWGVMLLTQCQSPATVHRILTHVVCISADWRYVLACKAPMVTGYFNVNCERMAINLAGYLKLSDVSLLKTVTIDVLNAWGDHAYVLQMPLESQVAMTKVLLACILNLDSIDLQATGIEMKMIHCIPVRLESSDEVIRVLGMFIAETVVKTLAKGRNDDRKHELQFDYSGLGKSAGDILNELQHVVMSVEFWEEENKVIAMKNKCETDTPNVNTECTCKSFPGKCVGDRMLSQLAVECEMEKVTGKAELFAEEIVSKEKQGFPQQDSSFKKEIIDNAACDSEESVLDSDDDLIPYEMSDDFKQSEKKRPKYLRDLLDILREGDDIESYTEALKVADSLIKKQLPGDDISLGVDLLEILINMDDKYSMTDFDQLRYTASVAAVVAHPAPLAEYLGHQFGMQQGRYSFDRLTFILKVLTGSATTLSELKRRLGNDNVNLLVKQALEQTGKTRIFASGRRNPIEQKNEFSAVAGSFFFPLVHNIQAANILSSSNSDSIMLEHILHCLASITLCTTNCPIAPRISVELLALASSLHKHPQSRVRVAVVRCVGASVVCVGSIEGIDELETALTTACLWLNDMGKNDPDSRCRKLAADVSLLIVVKI
ncbi:telomere length regulation protein TEL2 homolog isoform X1 [Schistocerca serialis cubense]|uniref:telomere length regulation protein TEL2 homolog isoform X1 n=1 Tax=Schistocerca serialis cubense TaxID=2023355 RepID=UPI00214F2478|nr:telomere length regulation protein TEL2 homolog isoform X1 [Schistocerca serialis cubense]